MEIYLGNGDDSVGGDFSDMVLETISWPLNSQLTLEWVETLMGLLNQFTWKNSVSEFPLALPHSLAVSLVDCASQILDKEANCVKVNFCSENSRVIVVGDLHGQLHDLLKIFDQSGRPSQNQRFVFNGNYIGRGSWSLEVFLALVAWKVHTNSCLILITPAIFVSSHAFSSAIAVVLSEEQIYWFGQSNLSLESQETVFFFTGLKYWASKYGQYGPYLLKNNILFGFEAAKCAWFL